LEKLIFEELACIFVVDLDQFIAKNEKGLVKSGGGGISTFGFDPPWVSNGTKTDIFRIQAQSAGI
jgi:hypothetical protein